MCNAAIAGWPHHHRREAPLRRALPPHTLDVDVVLTGPGGSFRVPAFWSGGAEWRVRFAAPGPATYTWRSECSDYTLVGLQGAEGELRGLPYDEPLDERNPPW